MVNTVWKELKGKSFQWELQWKRGLDEQRGGEINLRYCTGGLRCQLNLTCRKETSWFKGICEVEGMCGDLPVNTWQGSGKGFPPVSSCTACNTPVVIITFYLPSVIVNVSFPVVNHWYMFYLFTLFWFSNGHKSIKVLNKYWKKYHFMCAIVSTKCMFSLFNTATLAPAKSTLRV